MVLSKLIKISKFHFPKLNIKYKDVSLLMKILAIVLFFNPRFKNYTTTIFNTIYFPSEKYIKDRDFSSSAVFLHELVHIQDMNNLGFFGPIIFAFLYLFPQILCLLFFPLLLVSWKVALFALLFLAPFPAYWRMKYERKAYFVSMYVMDKFEKKFNVNFRLNDNKKYFIKQFAGPSYYFMWYLPGISKQFDKALEKVRNGEKPVDESSLIVIDKILAEI